MLLFLRENRNLSVAMLNLLEHWFKNCFSCVKWNHVFSDSFAVTFGVRQGTVLSPLLFTIYVDDLPAVRSPTPRSFIILYADDILLIAPSVTELQSLFHACEKELKWLDMKINVKKSCCVRIDQRYDNKCANITDSHGFSLPWVKEIRYLGT